MPNTPSATPARRFRPELTRVPREQRLRPSHLGYSDHDEGEDAVVYFGEPILSGRVLIRPRAGVPRSPATCMPPFGQGPHRGVHARPPPALQIRFSGGAQLRRLQPLRWGPLPDVGTGGTSEFGRSVHFCATPEKGLYFGYLHPRPLVPLDGSSV